MAVKTTLIIPCNAFGCIIPFDTVINLEFIKLRIFKLNTAVIAGDIMKNESLDKIVSSLYNRFDEAYVFYSNFVDMNYNFDNIMVLVIDEEVEEQHDHFEKKINEKKYQKRFVLFQKEKTIKYSAHFYSLTSNTIMMNSYRSYL